MSRRLRIATYNVHSCVGSDKQCNPERTLAVLREIDADIVALQEVGGNPLSDDVNQFHFFERHLDMRAVAGPNHRRRSPFGNAVFARWDIGESRLIDLSVSPFEPRGAIDCAFEVDGVGVRVIATHLGLFPHEREQQLRRLGTALQSHPQPLTIMLGDFNIFGPERRKLKRLGAPRQLPKLRSFPSRRPLMSLDRVWSIPNQNLVHIAVHKTMLSRAASDHLPLVAEISIETPVREGAQARNELSPA